MLGPWLPFPPEDWAEVPEGPGVYALADGEETLLAIASAQNLRQALQELAAAPPRPLQDLATHLWVEATPEPERSRAEPQLWPCSVGASMPVVPGAMGPAAWAASGR